MIESLLNTRAKTGIATLAVTLLTTGCAGHVRTHAPQSITLGPGVYVVTSDGIEQTNSGNIAEPGYHIRDLTPDAEIETYLAKEGYLPSNGYLRSTQGIGQVDSVNVTEPGGYLTGDRITPAEDLLSADNLSPAGMIAYGLVSGAAIENANNPYEVAQRTAFAQETFLYTLDILMDTWSDRESAKPFDIAVSALILGQGFNEVCDRIYGDADGGFEPSDYAHVIDTFGGYSGQGPGPDNPGLWMLRAYGDTALRDLSDRQEGYCSPSNVVMDILEVAGLYYEAFAEFRGCDPPTPE
ncbi:hypothetical protein HYW21_00725 [Candidatus Woesearchaeota archaeon]|nr:hypothetical protein [Candidatus Woesearchaeota archaeon]